MNPCYSFVLITGDKNVALQIWAAKVLMLFYLKNGLKGRIMSIYFSSTCNEPHIWTRFTGYWDVFLFGDTLVRVVKTYKKTPMARKRGVEVVNL